MILVDTSVWVAYLRQSNQDISDILKSYLKRNEVFAVSAVFGELMQGVKNKRERELIEVLWENLPKVNESDLFVQAGILSNKNRFYARGIGLIDCYILAAALKHDLALWTLDKKLGEAADSFVED